jgi:hypothetical protein
MRRLALAAALLAGGCIDFKEITPPDRTPPEAPAEFHASLTLDEQDTRRRGVRISALLDPGRDERGVPRPVGDDTLRVSGTPLAPARVEPTGARLYEGWIPLPTATGVLLRISPPAVPQGTRPPVLYQPIPVRLGADTLTLEPGADLRLPFSVPSLPPGLRPLEQSWMLQISGARPLLSISGQSLPPSPLVVPAALIPESPDRWLTAQLLVNSRTGVGRPEGEGYFIEVLLDASLGWSVLRGESPARDGR